MWRSLIISIIFIQTTTSLHYQMFNCGGTGKCTIINARSFNDLNNYLQKRNAVENFYGADIPFGEIYSIKFANSYLGDFPQLLLIRLDNLREIDFYGASVMKITKQDLVNGQKIEKLGLGSNKLVQIEDELFSTTPALKDLDLSKNPLNEFPKGAFMNCCQRLERLNLSETNFYSVGNGFLSNFPALVDLDLSNNRLQTVNDGTFNGCCQKLEKLDLSGNLISTIQDNTFIFFKQAQPAYNNRNNAAASQKSSKLSLNRNKFVRFVCDFTVDELYLSQNNLEDITTSSCNIKKLDVSDNRLKTITINSKMTSLNIQNNQISEVICNDGSNLSEVNLANNLLSIETLNCLSQDVASVDFSNNKIGAVTKTTFQKLQNVRTLKIPNTQINSIEQGSFYSLQNLQCLDISKNYLNTINIYEFQNCKQLTTFYCGGNQLTEIVNVNQIKVYMPKVRKIEISNNPWSCSYLGSMIPTLNQQGVMVIVLQPVAYGTPNVGGVACDVPVQQSNVPSYTTTTHRTTALSTTTTMYRPSTTTTRTTPRMAAGPQSTVVYCQPSQNAQQVNDNYRDLKEKLEKVRDRLREVVNDLKIIEFEVDVLRNLTEQYANQV